MKLTYKQITESKEPLLGLARQITKPGIAVSFQLMLQEFDAALKVYGEVLDGMLKRYGTEAPPHSGRYHIAPENWSAYRKGVEELSATAIRIKSAGRFKMNTLVQNDARLTGEMLQTLDWLIIVDVAPEFDEMPEGEQAVSSTSS